MNVIFVSYFADTILLWPCCSFTIGYPAPAYSTINVLLKILQRLRYLDHNCGSGYDFR